MKMFSARWSFYNTTTQSWFWCAAFWKDYHNLPWYCFRRKVQIGGKGRFWCAASNSVNRTCSTSTLFCKMQFNSPQQHNTQVQHCHQQSTRLCCSGQADSEDSPTWRLAVTQICVFSFLQLSAITETSEQTDVTSQWQDDWKVSLGGQLFPCGWLRYLETRIQSAMTILVKNNHFQANQGHCASCHKKWSLTTSDKCQCGKWQTSNDVSHRQQMPTDHAVGWPTTASLGWICRCLMVDVTWLVMRMMTTTIMICWLNSWKAHLTWFQLSYWNWSCFQACYSRKFVRQFLCVNFAYVNSYVRNAIHETFLRTKNRKFVRKYTHGLSCRMTENFRKYGEYVNSPRCLISQLQHKFVYDSVCKQKHYVKIDVIKY